MSEEQYYSASHCKYLIQYHIIWCPKFRFHVTWNYCRTSMIPIGKKYGIDTVFALTKAEDVWYGVENCLQYNHTADNYMKKKLSDRFYKLSDGTLVQRDWYSSFLLYCYDYRTLWKRKSLNHMD